MAVAVSSSPRGQAVSSVARAVSSSPSGRRRVLRCRVLLAPSSVGPPRPVAIAVSASSWQSPCPLRPVAIAVSSVARAVSSSPRGRRRVLLAPWLSPMAEVAAGCDVGAMTRPKRSRNEEEEGGERETDPAVFISLREGAIHEALGLPNAPCVQGANVTQSGQNFREWLNTTMCNRTPLNTAENCLHKGYDNNCEEFFKELFIGLKPGLVASLERVLGILFSQRHPPPGSTAEWTDLCRTNGLLLGHIFVIGAQGYLWIL